jgi:outer membrane protein OmpA-like peptidoglycan-associated protein
VIVEGDRRIFRDNRQTFIYHDEGNRLRFAGGDYRRTDRSGGGYVSFLNRPDGSRVEIEVDNYNRPLRRVRILPDGRRFTLFENRAVAAGAGLALGGLIVDLPPPRYSLRNEDYIVSFDRASEEDLYEAFSAPPVEPLPRTYTLDEIRASVRLRERMRSVNIDTINFDFGSYELRTDQYVLLERVAAVLRDIISQNPGEVFLIEGHTDAVGSDIDNLSLSDRRAESVATVLSREFNVPAENLVTQGYGKQFLLVQTDGPERRNRRVVIRRITPLLSTEGGDQTSDTGFEDRRRRY